MARIKNSHVCWILVLGVLNLLNASVPQNINTAIMYCDYNGEDTDTIYSVPVQINYATVFELPAGKEIKNIVIGDPNTWRATVDDDGKICFVKPLEQGIRTSLTIVTTDNKILVFNLIENTIFPEKATIAKVKIIMRADEFFISRNRDKAGKKTIQEKKEAEILQFIRKKTKKYRVKNNQFFIENVVDDGVFTYLYVPKAQYRPAVYFREASGKKLEPVRYVDKGEYFVVHKVLVKKGEIFLLKLGKTETEIRYKGK